jgi:hypothetical protein
MACASLRAFKVLVNLENTRESTCLSTHFMHRFVRGTRI